MGTGSRFRSRFRSPFRSQSASPVEPAAVDTGLASLAPGPFVALVGTVLLAGMAALLGLNTVLAQDSFHLHTLKTSTADLTAQQQQLEARVQALADPGALAQSAKEMGMVPAGAPAFVKDGQVVGAGSGPAPQGTTVGGTLVVQGAPPSASPSPTKAVAVAPASAPAPSSPAAASSSPSASSKAGAAAKPSPSQSAKPSASPSGSKKPSPTPTKR